MSVGTPGGSPRARIFGTGVEDYARYRPGPAPEALDWLLRPGDHDIVDVGAGTGQLTRMLVARGAAVTAVEPDPEMRTALAAHVPGASAIAGTAERLPVPDASQDVVVSHAAEHWFDPRRSGVEAARVLRPRGRLGGLRTGFDPGLSWIDELWERLEPDPVERRPGGRRASPARRSLGVMGRLQRGRLFGGPGAPFQRRESEVVAFTRSFDATELLGLMRTYSGFLVAPAGEQARRLAAMRALIDERLEGRDRIEVPMVTRCWRAELRRR